MHCECTVSEKVTASSLKTHCRQFLQLSAAAGVLSYFAQEIQKSRGPTDWSFAALLHSKTHNQGKRAVSVCGVRKAWDSFCDDSGMWSSKISHRRPYIEEGVLYMFRATNVSLRLSHESATRRVFEVETVASWFKSVCGLETIGAFSVIECTDRIRMPKSCTFTARYS